MCHCVLLIDIMRTAVVRPRTILVEISVFSRKVRPSRVLLEYHTSIVCRLVSVVFSDFEPLLLFILYCILVIH